MGSSPLGPVPPEAFAQIPRARRTPTNRFISDSFLSTPPAAWSGRGLSFGFLDDFGQSDGECRIRQSRQLLEQLLSRRLKEPARRRLPLADRRVGRKLLLRRRGPQQQERRQRPRGHEDGRPELEREQARRREAGSLPLEHLPEGGRRGPLRAGKFREPLSKFFVLAHRMLLATPSRSRRRRFPRS